MVTKIAESSLIPVNSHNNYSTHVTHSHSQQTKCIYKTVNDHRLEAEARYMQHWTCRCRSVGWL